jgi:octaprenyl-diphosphate synthase
MFHFFEKEKIKAYLKEELNNIEKALQEERVSQNDFINQVSEYLLFAGGKRIRPLLFVLSAKLCQNSSKNDFSFNLYRTSLLFEYLHTATLLHDDVVDSAEFRRGRKAARTLWGNQATILVGDYLYAKALRMASELSTSQAMDVITKTTLLMSEGEVLQLLNFDRLSMSEEDYFEVIYRKTAVLMSACCEVGAIVSQASPEEQRVLSSFGCDLGLAFQIIDDLLDWISEETGKDLGRDFFEGKITLPVILALRSAKDEAQRELRELFTKPNPTKDDFIRARGLIEEAQGFSLARLKAEKLLKKAKSALNIFKDSQAKSALNFIADYILERKS